MCKDDSCPEDQVCIPTFNAIECRCRRGYQLEVLNETCVDVEECDLGLCADDATCENTIGSFECKCDDGYVGDGYHRCQDVDECATLNIGEEVDGEMGPCTGTCYNLPG